MINCGKWQPRFLRPNSDYGFSILFFIFPTCVYILALSLCKYMYSISFFFVRTLYMEQVCCQMLHKKCFEAMRNLLLYDDMSFQFCFNDHCRIWVWSTKGTG